MVNRNDATKTEEWRDLPIEQQMSWRIPISTMLNMTLLRNRHSVITVSDYLRLHNISGDVELSNGHWGRETYHRNTESGQMPSLHVIENHLYDPKSIVRVDVIPDDMKKRGGWTFRGGRVLDGENTEWNETLQTVADNALRSSLADQTSVLEWDRAHQILKDSGLDTNEQLERFLNDNGWEVLYTYKGA